MGVYGQDLRAGSSGKGAELAVGMDVRRAGVRLTVVPDISASACCIVLSVDRMSVISAACGDVIARQVNAEIRYRLWADKDAFLTVDSVDSEDDNLVLHVAGGGTRELERQLGLLIEKVTKRPVVTDWGEVYVTISAGGVVSAIAKVGSRWMVAWANHALADARNLGGNRVKIVSAADHLQGWFRRAMRIMGQVCEAHAAGRMSLSFQPVIGRDGTVFYYECLLRAVDEFGDQLLPGEFVPVMEQMGAIGWLDRFVFEQVIAELRAAPGICLGCNVSGQSISDPGCMAEMLDMLRPEPDLARRLVIEITETSAITDIARAADLVAELRATGCRVALDDFGVGFASFAHLRALDVDIVKLDQSFLEDSAGTSAWLQGIEHLAALVRKLGLQIVVEGVQSQAQLEVLDLADITHVQGYCLGAPSPKRPWQEDGGSAAFSPRSLHQIATLNNGAA